MDSSAMRYEQQNLRDRTANKWRGGGTSRGRHIVEHRWCWRHRLSSPNAPRCLLRSIPYGIHTVESLTGRIHFLQHLAQHAIVYGINGGRKHPPLWMWLGSDHAQIRPQWAHAICLFSCLFLLFFYSSLFVLVLFQNILVVVVAAALLSLLYFSAVVDINYLYGQIVLPLTKLNYILFLSQFYLCFPIFLGVFQFAAAACFFRFVRRKPDNNWMNWIARDEFEIITLKDIN